MYEVEIDTPNSGIHSQMSDSTHFLEWILLQAEVIPNTKCKSTSQNRGIHSQKSDSIHFLEWIQLQKRGDL